MAVPRIHRTPWPRTRLQLRSIISSTMVIGWIWVAASALIPTSWFREVKGQEPSRFSASPEVPG